MRTLILFTLSALLSVNFAITRGTPLQRCDDRGNTQPGISASETPVHTLAATISTASKLFSLLSNTTASSQSNTTGTTTAPTSAAPAQTPESITTAPSPTKKACKDYYIWAGDGSFYCYELYTPTPIGINKDPGYWCNTYELTYCCATCSRLRAEGVIS